MTQIALLSLSVVSLILGSLPAQASRSHDSHSDWHNVQVLPTGTSIHVQAGKRHQSCRLKSVDAESVTCADGRNPVYSRTEITSIKLTHRGRSTLVAALAGGGIGAAVAAGLSAHDPHCQSFQLGCLDGLASTGAVVGAFSAVGTVVGAPIGYLTDFTRSTVYKAAPRD